MDSERWCIHIDMEGFGALYGQEDQILWSFCELMRAIYRIGTRVYPEPPDRLFVHQTGDGFAILSDFHEPLPLRAVAIAVVLMRHVASTGRYARAAISEGDHADIVGCYPREVTDSRDPGDDTAILGHGLMTLFPVMGTALIRAVGVAKRSPPGPLLLLDRRFETRLPPEFLAKKTNERPDAALSVDWIHRDVPLAEEIWSQLDLSTVSNNKIEEDLISYCKQYDPRGWTPSLQQFLALDL